MANKLIDLDGLKTYNDKVKTKIAEKQDKITESNRLSASLLKDVPKRTFNLKLSQRITENTFGLEGYSVFGVDGIQLKTWDEYLAHMLNQELAYQTAEEIIPYKSVNELLDNSTYGNPVYTDGDGASLKGTYAIYTQYTSESGICLYIIKFFRGSYAAYTGDLIYSEESNKPDWTVTRIEDGLIDPSGVYSSVFMFTTIGLDVDAIPYRNNTNLPTIARDDDRLGIVLTDSEPQTKCGGYLYFIYED